MLCCSSSVIIVPLLLFINVCICLFIYSPASIVSALEKKNLGTKATRASILETLYNRGYIQDKSIKATSLGMSLIKTLEQNCPIIIDENLTGEISKDMEKIRNAKSPLEKEKKILKETEKSIHKIGGYFEKNREKIGKDLVNATTKMWAQQKKDNETSLGCGVYLHCARWDTSMYLRTW